MSETLPPIFLFGSERSGSNLLRTLLGNHPQVEAPVAPHFFDSFLPFVRFYGDLRVEANMRALLADMHAFVQHPFNGWELEADPDRLMAAYRPQCFFAACDALWRARAAQSLKATFMSKDNHLFNYAFEIKAQWPDARFLYLYRDPRDQCASWVTTPFHLKTVQDIAMKWEREQRRCQFLQETHGFRLHPISYEDLIADTPQVMSKVLEHCGLEVDARCFQTDPKRTQEAGRLKLWENLNKPIIRANKRKYTKVLTADQVRKVETICAPQMRRLGYAFDTAADWTPPLLHGLRRRWEWRAMHRRSMALQDDELLLLREKQDFLRLLRQRVEQRARQGEASAR